MTAFDALQISPFSRICALGNMFTPIIRPSIPQMYTNVFYRLYFIPNLYTIEVKNDHKPNKKYL